MAAMMLMKTNFINAQKPLLKFIDIRIISWLPPLFHNFFHPGF